MIRRWGVALVATCLALPAAAAPQPMTRDAIVALGKTVVGFSYWWGGGAWKPGSTDTGQCIPKDANGCPNCTHKGPYGADCSGFVAKAWQIDKPTPLEQNYHPYSTWHFANQSTWWTGIAKKDALRADAFNYNKNGAGHIFLYDKGDPWGKVYAWECKGCVYGCVYGLRSVSTDYEVLRRKLISDAQVCKPQCQGSVLIGADCGKGDCAAFGSSCVSDALGPRCVSAFCPAQGTTQTCVPDGGAGKSATCVNGALQNATDCAAQGAICSTALAQPACASTLCVSAPNQKPTAGDVCHQGQRYSCDSQGKATLSPCAGGTSCQTVAGQSGPGSGSCGPKPCDSCDDGNPCTADVCSDGLCTHPTTAATCDDGNACTEGDTCQEGTCQGKVKACDDGVSCTLDSCAGGVCSNQAEATACDDGNLCTTDSCTSSGCSHVAQAGPCEDGDGCSVGGGCKDGICQSGVAKMCDDENGCTLDGCQDGSCTHAPLQGACSDGDPCTVGDYCAQGQCLSGTSQPPPCVDAADATAGTDDATGLSGLGADATATAGWGDRGTSSDGCSASRAGQPGPAGIATVVLLLSTCIGLRQRRRRARMGASC